TDWFCDYRTHDEIRDWYINHAKINKGSVKFINSIGKTYKGRDIFAVHLTNPVNYGPPKKKVWLQSLIHAREWISGSTTQFIFDYLLKNKDSNPQVKKLLNDIEIIFIPIVNIDGYIYTHTVNRLQRKNLNFEAGGNGVDLNRNYPYHWGGEGASPDPNHFSYRGSSPASEPETQAIISYYNKTGPFDGAIDFHSYGQLVLRPYTDNNRDSPTEAEHKKLGDGIRDSIQSVRGTPYISQKFIDMYAGAGAMTDWTCGDQCQTYSYLIELSPKNEGQDLQGFILPPSDIVPIGNETISGVLYFL
ncbi:peptidase M14, carboxypeptidase A, partial [Conidiobolus coronatus NRRL 28638]